MGVFEEQVKSRFAQRLKRLMLGLTQKDVEQLTGIKQGVITRLVNAKMNPTIKQIIKLANGFGVAPGYFLDERDDIAEYLFSMRGWSQAEMDMALEWMKAQNAYHEAKKSRLTPK